MVVYGCFKVSQTEMDVAKIANRTVPAVSHFTTNTHGCERKVGDSSLQNKLHTICVLFYISWGHRCRDLNKCGSPPVDMNILALTKKNSGLGIRFLCSYPTRADAFPRFCFACQDKGLYVILWLR